ncbi:ArnT family glycosyltransferase [Joostella sp.]|uniref:ArnT family glycosyltransferase n=1 Tax=Joostella sp. TaxID=2231138 RepID=UPI003A92C5BD
MEDKTISRHVLLVAIISFLAILIIPFFKVALEWEDAEQAYYSQWFRLGYDDQPPLYTWIQILFNKLLGVNRFSLAGLRAILFSGTLIVMYKLAINIQKSRKLAEVTVFLLFLIPVFIDFNFRRLSHTSMMCFLSVSLYYIYSLLLEAKTIRNYVFLGLIIACGILTKYNFLLQIPAFIILPFIDSESKRVLWDKKLIVTILIVLILISPHFYWLFDNSDYILLLRESMDRKTGASASHGIFLITPVLAFLKSFFNIIFPTILIFSIAYYKRKVIKNHTGNNWFKKLFFLQLLVVVAIFIFINSAKISDRWLLPLFLPFFVLLLNSFEYKNIALWKRWSMRVFLIVVFVQLIRTPIEKLLKIDSSVHHSFEPIATILKDDYPDLQWNLPNVTYAGSIRYEVPENTVFAADDFTLPKGTIDSTRTVFVLNERNIDYKILDSIVAFGEDKEAVFFCKKRIDAFK